MSGVLLITGGSRGVGAATARLAAAGGWRVALSYRQGAAEAAGVVAEITAAGGVAQAFRADVAIEDDVVSLFAAVDHALGPLGGLVNNAGVVQTQMRVDEMSAERIARVFAVNVVGAFLCAGEAVRRMSTRHGGAGGAIVNVSSAAARTGSPREYVDYAASKAAIDTFTLGLAREVADEGIRVNAVRPGLTYTQIHADGGEPGRVDRLRGLVPMRRGGQPEEIGRAILWLLSDEASYTTGALLDVTGGL
jgi:NAD(P)-dependent dehydrogenase (short-subunit alcohol dehydrogenase family)